MEIERPAGGRVNIRMGKPVRKERLVRGRGNRRMGKPVRKGKVGRPYGGEIEGWGNR